MKKNESLAYSAIGIVALFFVLVAANYLLAQNPERVDLTQGKVYTLSEGTGKLLKNLDGPVKLKFYATQGEAVPVPLRSFAQRVQDMLAEFARASNGKLQIIKRDPKPDSEVEDEAQLDGIEPQQLSSGEQFYLGLVVSRLDRRQAISTLSPQRERLLEYDLARAIARVSVTDRPTLGLLSALPVLGTKFNPFTRQGSEPWVLANELKRDYDIKQVDFTAETIDPSIKVLLVIHPRDLPEQTEYALDQFVLRGGKLIVFVDPYA